MLLQFNVPDDFFPLSDRYKLDSHQYFSADQHLNARFHGVLVNFPNREGIKKIKNRKSHMSERSEA